MNNTRAIFKILTLAIIIFFSCNYGPGPDESICTKVKIEDGDFTEINFKALPDSIRAIFVSLAMIDKKMDTVLSLQKGIGYSYKNPGDKKGYIGQVLNNKNMHIINGKCFEFSLYAKPYIVYDSTIYCLKQNLVMNCGSGICYPDTTGLAGISFYSIPLSKIIRQ